MKPSAFRFFAKFQTFAHPLLAVIQRSAFRDEGPLFDFHASAEPASTTVHPYFYE
jgi:hypothetical protein